MHNNGNYARQLNYLLETSDIKKPIVLVGSAGSGKSTVGRRFAKKVKLQFYDSDRIIEQREGMSVIEIYDKYGQEYFTKREKEVIEEILSSYGTVVLSTGSNAFIDKGMRDFIKANAVTIWLYADINVLSERISRRNSRPGFTPGNIEETLKDIITRHYPIYNEADIAVESHEHDIYKVVDILILKLKEHFESLLI
jgi:shikimate kinase